MRSKKMLVILVLGLVVSLAMIGKAVPMGTSWTYQGRLMDANKPADGLYDFQFKLFDANVAGIQQGNTIDVNEADVIDGYFTVELDFGSDVFNGNARWLDIGVRPWDSEENHALLTPRQEVTPTPYALNVRVPLILSRLDAGSVIMATNSAGYGGIGVYGEATGRSGHGVYGKATDEEGSGVHGEATGEDGTGILGYASGDASYGVQGSHIDSSTAGRLGGFMYGVWGRHYDSGNYGYIGSENYAGYFDGNTVVTGNVGIGTRNPAAKLDVVGSDANAVISATNNDSTFFGSGVSGYSNGGKGVYGEHSSGNYGHLGSNSSGVTGHSDSANGVYGSSYNSTGVKGHSIHHVGVYGSSTHNYAGYFNGDVGIFGNLTKSSGSFKIDHPLDPENKYLYHSFIESPDMMNIYNGNVTLDKNGEAVVKLPDYFEALNRDFRYQLTCIGGFAPVYVAEEISDNQFKIAGGKRRMKVSWQVTGVRKDAYAKANPIVVEEDKSVEDRGYYLHPTAFSLPEEKGIESLHKPQISEARQIAKVDVGYEID